MRYVFLIAALLAIVARVTVFAEPGHIEALAIFLAFWLCVGGYLAVSFTQ